MKHHYRSTKYWNLNGSRMKTSYWHFPVYTWINENRALAVNERQCKALTVCHAAHGSCLEFVKAGAEPHTSLILSQDRLSTAWWIAAVNWCSLRFINPCDCGWSLIQWPLKGLEQPNYWHMCPYKFTATKIVYICIVHWLFPQQYPMPKHHGKQLKL